jgi:hypothetical protein
LGPQGPAGPGVPTGGSTGQVLQKNSGTNYDASWLPAVTSFNTRTGAVALALADVTGAGGAPLSSPALTGTPTAPTAAATDNSTTLATTAFVQVRASVQNRNRLINGHFIVDQYNNFAPVTPTAASYVCDRWSAVLSQSSKLQMLAFPASTTVPGGIAGGIQITTVSAFTPAGTDYFFLSQAIEFQNITDFAFGSASASPITLSFWAKASVAGTYSGSLRNTGGARSFVFTFALVANTWTKVTVPVAGDTAGTWYPGSANGVGIYVDFDLGVGTRTATLNSWIAGNLIGATGAVSLVANAGAILNIANIQLELGSVATPFDWQSVADTLAACRRYFQDIWFILYAPAANVAGFGGAVQQITYPVCMRAAPTALATDNILSSVWTGTTTPTYVFAPDSIRVSSPTTQANAGAFLIGRTRLQAEL